MTADRQQPVFSPAATPTLQGALRTLRNPAAATGEARVAAPPVLQRAAAGRQLRLF